tara:strand:+ start:662 stop:1084 length:423 start_codon:yes stop_codon:yes gene_type:complete
LFFLLAEVLQPINCILVSEDVPTISIVLKERRVNSLKGKIYSSNKVKGDFFTQRATRQRSANWSFVSSNVRFTGDMVLFKDQEIWHSFQSKIKGKEVNRVLFPGLAFKLSTLTNEIDLLKASSGFFRIGEECYGGRINKV